MIAVALRRLGLYVDDTGIWCASPDDDPDWRKLAENPAREVVGDIAAAVRWARRNGLRVTARVAVRLDPAKYGQEEYDIAVDVRSVDAQTGVVQWLYAVPDDRRYFGAGAHSQIDEALTLEVRHEMRAR